MRSIVRIQSALVLCGTIGLLGACSKSEEAPKPVPTVAPARPTAAPVPQAAFQVSRIDLGTVLGADKKIAAPATTFKPSDTITRS